ncbi:MAG: YczE/YyaS/YitT family protein [Rhodoluna sp.]
MKLGFDIKSLRRLLRLNLGLLIYGLALSMVINAHIGIPPWDVFAQGISIQLHTSYGVASIIVSTIVLIVWVPLRIKPGVGSILNAILIGLWADFWTQYLPHLDQYWQNLAMFLLGTATVAFATGLYITSNLGSGPRDGLILGLTKLLGWKVWQLRTALELVVLTIGWIMGGQVREGTVIFAVTIGYLMQGALKFFKYQPNRTK